MAVAGFNASLNDPGWNSQCRMPLGCRNPGLSRPHGIGAPLDQATGIVIEVRSIPAGIGNDIRVTVGIVGHLLDRAETICRRDAFDPRQLARIADLLETIHRVPAEGIGDNRRISGWIRDIDPVRTAGVFRHDTAPLIVVGICCQANATFVTDTGQGPRAARQFVMVASYRVVGWIVVIIGVGHRL